MITERHNVACRLIMKAISKGSLAGWKEIEKENLHRQWNDSLHLLRKRRHIGPKSRESPPPGRLSEWFGMKNYWGSGGWQAAPCSRPRPWEQLGFSRTRLVVDSLCASSTEWACNLRAVLWAFYTSRPSSLRWFKVCEVWIGPTPRRIVWRMILLTLQRCFL